MGISYDPPSRKWTFTEEVPESSDITIWVTAKPFYGLSENVQEPQGVNTRSLPFSVPFNATDEQIINASIPIVEKLLSEGTASEQRFLAWSKQNPGNESAIPNLTSERYYKYSYPKVSDVVSGFPSLVNKKEQ
jgi:hypothetical protein